MSLLYNKRTSYRNKPKLLYYSPKIWRYIYLVTNNPIYMISEKKIYNRSSTIPLILLREKSLIYTGRKWHTKKISRWMVGFKFGEFTWNRKLALYKAKQSRKKKKK